MILARLKRRFAMMAIAFGLIGWTSMAHGQPSAPSDETRAKAAGLFAEARALMKAGEHAKACPKLEEAARLADGVGILYNLADCHVQNGQTASAWLGFRAVAARMQEAGQKSRADDASDRAAALEPQLTQMRLAVAERLNGMTIRRNDEVVPSEQWDQAVPVDPGSYAIHVEAPGMQPWSTRVEARGAGAMVAVQIPALAKAPAPEPADKVTPPPPQTPLPTRAPSRSSDPLAKAPDDHGSGDWQTPVGIAGMAIGGAGLLTAGALAAAAKVNADAADCNDANKCSADGVQERAEAVTLGNAATGMLVAGGVLAGAGLIVWLAAPADDGTGEAGAKKDLAQLRLQPTTDGACMSVHLKW